ncbi:nucleoside triphosphate hydrolase [Halomonas elongata]|uniref:Nucleoside triphosphate hydrolase n=1 Tax=Halomonas elongata (strain ATCC 33173 / DSM 2581 / NBRC 15536 / NCIMB 2198 / 1H9) TaxID=768066 RepID=E1VCL8_HALED|nr:nucleoside triphosphate hydrolase [Halomonas elongata]MDL4863963.1 nucleoside triphosphate hydrolase [Halomonas elongata]WBF19658.1 nucleoside triphosphate hydrolase [Halomonas elongata]WPU48523.1 nucleoside triphosphate hydrolase [Halomonas elongata DSM 2581]CBV42373.1 YggC family protein [Halomonas elongata DSM 2581]
MTPNIHEVTTRVLEAAGESRRFIVALAGPPAAGKSFLSGWLCRELNARQAGCAAVVPMDGYHYDNAVLEPRGLVPVKGAPETFDCAGLKHDLQRIRRTDGSVAVPVFDRALDLARAGGRLITLEHRIVIVEGNYLLLDEGPWPALRDDFDFSLFLEVPDEVLEARLIERWLGMGQDQAGAVERARHKDMLNAHLIKSRSVAADLHWAASD